MHQSVQRQKDLLEASFSSIQDGISILKPDLSIQDVNPVMEKWYAQKDPLRGKKCYEVYQNSTKPCNPCPTLRCFKSGKTESNIVSGHPRSPDVKWIELFSYPIKDQNTGELCGAVEFARDITERKRAEERLEKALVEKDYLIKEINHRVKNNLTMISSLINLKAVSSDKQFDISDIRRQIDAIRIIHEKLNVSKDITQIDARDYFDDLLVTVFSSMLDIPVTIENSIEYIVLPTTIAVPLGLIIHELATNAGKHGCIQKTEPVFKVELRADDGKDQYSLLVSNNGAPFPEEIDIENPTTLGLQLIVALVGQLKGILDLERAPYPEFRISFPRTVSR